MTSDYTELFDDTSDYGKRARLAYPYRRKILVKGGLGTGKSVFAKKIIHDWANGTFRMYTVVSFIDMRSVEIDDPMGAVLVQQGGLSQEEVKHIFYKSTANSLLVMDGLDLSKNVKDILKFVTDQRPNVLVTTSGVTDTGSIENYFDTVCSVKGFVGSEACRFLESVEKTTKPDVLFNAKVSLPNIIDTPLETNPLLLIFMHILQENKILEQKSGSESTSADAITLCEIYFQLVKFLSKSLEADKFLTVLKQIGKLALDTWQNGTVLKSSDIPINWYDIGLVVKGTGGDALFPHGSMQIFLGALYLVLTLEAEDGTTVESLIGSNCQRPALMTNSLFLHFCLTLVGDQKYVVLTKGEAIKTKLKEFVRDQIDMVQLDLHEYCHLVSGFEPFHRSQTKQSVGSRILYGRPVDLSECSGAVFYSRHASR